MYPRRVSNSKNAECLVDEEDEMGGSMLSLGGSSPFIVVLKKLGLFSPSYFRSLVFLMKSGEIL